MTAPVRAFDADKCFFGVAIGLVTDRDDPSGEGRVRLRYPWFSDDMTSEWARVAQPYAGNGFGFYWVPEVDSEVLVGFERGDMRFPVVLGGLYNGKDLPPFPLGASTDPKVIQTQAGHRILFEDKDGQQKIEIVDASGNNSITIDTTSSKISITASGDISVEASGKLTLSGQTGVEISSPAAVTVRGATIGLN